MTDAQRNDEFRITLEEDWGMYRATCVQIRRVGNAIHRSEPFSRTFAKLSGATEWALDEAFHAGYNEPTVISKIAGQNGGASANRGSGYAGGEPDERERA